MKKLISGLILLAFVLISCNQLSLNPRIFAARDSVIALLETVDGQKVFSCTGTVVQWDAPRVLTAAHCIGDKAPKAYWRGAEYDLEIVGVNDTKDYAILTAPSGIAVTPMAARNPAVGDVMYTWQSPEGFAPLLSTGVWQGTMESVYNELPPRFIDFKGFGIVQFGTNGGGSGSAILNANGEVVGVISAKFSFTSALDSTIIGLPIP